jgi:L-aspartate oxidase
VHGANRLASNSLLEAVVFGARVATLLAGGTEPVAMTDVGQQAKPGQGVSPALRQAMQAGAGVLRDGAGLMRTQRSIWRDFANADDSARNALLAAELIVGGALLRRESRGGHCRRDFPQSADPPRHSRFTLSELRARTGDLTEAETS